jgi:hypothetical protein
MKHPLMRLLAIALLLAAPIAPTVASGDLFQFNATQGDVSFTLMMHGREDIGAIHVVWTGAPAADRNLPYRQYYVEFDRARQRLYVRPRKRDGLPWFELDVVGSQGDVRFLGRRLHGEADWDIR